MSLFMLTISRRISKNARLHVKPRFTKYHCTSMVIVMSLFYMCCDCCYLYIKVFRDDINKCIIACTGNKKINMIQIGPTIKINGS